MLYYSLVVLLVILVELSILAGVLLRTEAGPSLPQWVRRATLRSSFTRYFALIAGAVALTARVSGVPDWLRYSMVIEVCLFAVIYTLWDAIVRPDSNHFRE